MFTVDLCGPFGRFISLTYWALWAPVPIPGAPSAPAIPEVVNCGLVQRVSPPMCSLRHRYTTMCRCENYLRINPQTATEMPKDTV